MATSPKPSGGCCAPAPAGLAHDLVHLLRRHGHALPGDTGRIVTDPQTRTITSVVVHVVDVADVAVEYRLQSVAPDGSVRTALVPAHTFVPNSRPTGGEGVDVTAEATRAIREELKEAEAYAAAQTGNEKGVAPGIVWRELGPQSGTFFSEDGRFGITSGNGWYRAHDLWTGERVEKLATGAAAKQWCKNRTSAPPLSWQQFGPVCVARAECGAGFAVASTLNGASVATDDRFSGSPLSFSPLFTDRATAQKWCAVRACCVVEAGAPGTEPALRYQDPVPF